MVAAMDAMSVKEVRVRVDQRSARRSSILEYEFRDPADLMPRLMPTVVLAHGGKKITVLPDHDAIALRKRVSRELHVPLSVMRGKSALESLHRLWTRVSRARAEALESVDLDGLFEKVSSRASRMRDLELSRRRVEIREELSRLMSDSAFDVDLEELTEIWRLTVVQSVIQA